MSNAFRYSEILLYYNIIERTKHVMIKQHKYPEMFLKLEAIVNRSQGVAQKIPKESFDEIIDGILTKNFHDLFQFTHSQVIEWESFEKFDLELDVDDYLISLELHVSYEALRGEVVNDVKFSIEEMTFFDSEGDNMVIDSLQSEQIKKAVECKNYTL